jgi:hypothetical protein
LVSRREPSTAEAALVRLPTRDADDIFWRFWNECANLNEFLF